MDKKEIIKILEEGLSLEEISTISNLEELKDAVDKSNIDSNVKKELIKRINILVKDTLSNAKTFAGLINYTENAKN